MLHRPWSNWWSRDTAGQPRHTAARCGEGKGRHPPETALSYSNEELAAVVPKLADVGFTRSLFLGDTAEDRAALCRVNHLVPIFPPPITRVDGHPRGAALGTAAIRR